MSVAGARRGGKEECEEFRGPTYLSQKLYRYLLSRICPLARRVLQASLLSYFPPPPACHRSLRPLVTRSFVLASTYTTVSSSRSSAELSLMMRQLISRQTSSPGAPCLSDMSTSAQVNHQSDTSRIRRAIQEARARGRTCHQTRQGKRRSCESGAIGVAKSVDCRKLTRMLRSSHAKLLRSPASRRRHHRRERSGVDRSRRIESETTCAPRLPRNKADRRLNQVIVTSHLFPAAAFSLSRLKRISSIVGKDRLVIDVRCAAGRAQIKRS